MSDQIEGSYASRMAAHYAAVSHRLRGPDPKPRVRFSREPVAEEVKPEPRYSAPERDFLFVSLPSDPESPERNVLVPMWRVILAEVAKKHRVSATEIKGPQRNRNIVAARHEAFYRMARETSMSLPQIGRRMGGKDHTTVIHGIRRHALREGLEVARGLPETGVLGPGGWK